MNPIITGIAGKIWISDTGKYIGFYQSIVNEVPSLLHNSWQRRATKHGPADLLKTISIGLIAGGLIFKGLIGPFLLVIGYSAITSGE